MNVPLELRYQAQPLREAAAWLIPGAAASEWLAELIVWQAPLDHARLYAMPRSPTDRAAAGVLVLLPAGAAPATTHRAQSYSLLANRLYLPIEGRLEPPVEERELADLLPAEDEIYLWHPVAGLICFPRQSALRVADLLAAPPSRRSRWDLAQPGTAVNSRLHSIQPDQPLDLAAVLEQGRGDIGRQAPELKQLPPSDRERQRAPLAGPAGAAKAAMARAVAWLTSFAPHTASQRTWINDLEDWAERTLGKYGDWLHAHRHKELTRLLDLLRNNPDEGLKYALPMGDGGHRGLADPSANLARRDVNFNLRRLGGGGPADVWDVPADYQQQLITRYRELANREIGLGRHRRAAYIFAELLGDYRSAAATLADGGHWREAAVLYQERLNQPRDAARCLRQGGHWSEAIELYEKLGEHETVGDLYRQLEEQEPAEQAYRRAAAEYLQGMNHLQAAKVLEHKLDQPEEAFECLLRGWPYSGQAGQCLQEAFWLLGRRARHEQALAQVQRLPDTVATAEGITLLASGLADVAGTYPDALVQLAAADQTRVLAASRLAVADPVEARTLTDALRSLAPQDRLLARDCHRYAALREAKASVPPPPPPSKFSLKLLKEIKLETCDWKAFVCSGDVFYAAGYRDDQLILVRGLPDGTVHQPHKKPWPIEPAFVGDPILMACDPQPGAERIFLYVPGSPRLIYDRSFPPCHGFHDLVTAGALRVFGQATVAIQYSQGMLHCAAFDEKSAHFTVTSCSTDGKLLGGHTFPTIVEAAGRALFPPCLLVREHLVCLAFSELLLVWDGQQERHIVLEQPVRSLCGSLPHTTTRIIATLEQGAMLFWGHPARVNGVPFAQELHQPVACFTRGGHVVAASRQEIQVYDTAGGELKFRAQVIGIGVEPVAVLPTLKRDEFIVAHADGRLLVYQVH